MLFLSALSEHAKNTLYITVLTRPLSCIFATSARVSRSTGPLYSRMNHQLNLVVTGATGMVGEGVLHECLKHPSVKKVLFVGRKSCGVSHEKLSEVMLSDFLQPEQISEQLRGYDACLFCLGVSSVGLKEQEYTTLTFDLTTRFASNFLQYNPGSQFVYVSGAGTDSTVEGRSMWARVKGKTENTLLDMGFQHAWMFRPGYIHPVDGMKFTLPMYRYVKWAYPFWKSVFPNYVSRLEEIGLAMIHVVRAGYTKTILEVPDINKAASLEKEWLKNPPAQPSSASNDHPQEQTGILPDRDLKKNLGCG